MKTVCITLMFAAIFSTGFGQVGIGTTSPQGALDVVSTNMGLVMPRVSSFEAVTDGSSGPPVDGTMVYDQLRSKTCIKIAGKWACTGFDGAGDFVEIFFYAQSNIGLGSSPLYSAFEIERIR